MKTKEQVKAGIAEAEERIRLNTMTANQSTNKVQRERSMRTANRALITKYALLWVLKEDE